MIKSLLEVRGLGKAFRDYGSEWRRFATWFGFGARVKSEVWVLRGVSFNVARGESIGIVGQNGAGKSTLLKLITGTLRGTEGSVAVNGRVAAILELGMGFSADLTGRENVYHTAGLMGFSREDIVGVMAAIEEFAEIGEYFDEPVRTYSSGMQMRVGFAIATAFRPDLLIVDEALSVGDAYFQHKCFNRIRQFREQGTSLLIVSHDSGAVQNLCDRALLLENGMLVKDGDPAEVMDLYNALIAERENSTIKVSKHASGRVQTVSGSGEAVVEDISLLNEAGEPVEFVDVGQPVTLVVRVAVQQDVPRLVLGYMIKDRLGQPVFGTNTHHTKQVLDNVHAGQCFEFRISFPMNFGQGSYSISTALVSTETHLVNNYEWRDLALVFSVSNMSRAVFVGTAWVPPQIEVRNS
ncbi:ABC transporter ATP-binding protein [Rhodanobacter sp. AS-Z3]|uniref:ABC transporter ATP-binding protein n=1 Tax=Rhodanobacter sp. AS-Z3 TaxID=3031330 RepID=UPI002479CA98|nr:ABC transporter ATP-binding protein [Rhodanobacter sp. AS-Z3]WEN14951.1 ABC transporter ATP-binding protein [Rhodanobacter sp. AS-Z3]